MSWPIAAAQSHRPARRWPPPVSPPAAPQAHGPGTLWSKPGTPCHPPQGRGQPCTLVGELLPSLQDGCLMGRHAQGMHIHGLGLCRRALVSGGFLQARSQAGRLQSPPKGCLSLLAQSSTLAPAPVPAQWDTGPVPRAGRHQR